MDETGKKQSKLIRALRKVGRQAFTSGYGAGRRSLESAGYDWYNTVALRTEFDRLVKRELTRGRKRLW